MTTNYPNCPACRGIYAGKNEEPPCENCRVDLLPENAEAARIYQLCRGQVITMADQVIDLNYLTLLSLMDFYRVEKQRECFELVVRTFHHFLEKQRAERT